MPILLIPALHVVLAAATYCTEIATLLLLAGATLRGQELQRTLQYQFPVPNAHLVSRETTIAIRPGDILDHNILNVLSLFNVTGSSSGLHVGKVMLSDDRRTIKFAGLEANSTVIRAPWRPNGLGSRPFVLISHDGRTSRGWRVTDCRRERQK